MPKKKKKLSALTYSPESVSAVKKQLRAFNWKRLLILVLSTLAAFALLEAVVSIEVQNRLEFSIITLVYYIIVTVLAASVILLNHGFSKKPFTRDMLREDVDDAEAERILSRLNRQKLWAKRLMLVLVPFMFALLLDIIYLFYGDVFGQIFGFLVPSA